MNKEQLEKFARENYIPVVRKATGEKLFQTVRELHPKKMLEIGTAIGYSGLILLSATDGNLVTIEKDYVRADLASEVFEQNGVSERVWLIEDDALETLKRLDAQGLMFDFVFLDGPKAQYGLYLPYIKRMLRRGGVLFADDIDIFGALLSGNDYPAKKKTIVEGVRKFLEELTCDKDFETQILRLEDGIAIAKKL